MIPRALSFPDRSGLASRNRDTLSCLVNEGAWRDLKRLVISLRRFVKTRGASLAAARRRCGVPKVSELAEEIAILGGTTRAWRLFERFDGGD